MIKNYKLAETWHLLEGRYVELFKIICISIIGSAVMSLICIAPLVGLFLFIFVINPVFMGCILLLIKHLLSADADIGIKSEHISKAINDSCSDCKRLIISTLFPFYKLTLFSLFFVFFCMFVFAGFVVIAQISASMAVMATFLIPIIIVCISICCFMILASISISIYARLISVIVGNDTTYQFEKDLKKANNKKIWWFLIPLVGEYLVQVSMTKSAIEYYRTSISEEI